MSIPIPLLPNELARRVGVGAALQCRPEPLRMRIELAGLTTRDRHDLRLMFDCSVRVAESRADQQMLAEVLLADREVLTREDAAKYLTRQVRGAIEASASGIDIADALDAAGRQQLLDVTRQAVDAAAFACGLLILPPFQIEVESASFQRQKLEQMQRDRAEARAAQQVEHLRRAGELIKQFQSLRDSTSSIAPGQVLQQISPADRGSTLEALLLASAQGAAPAPLWAVAGPYLVKTDPRAAQPSIELLNLPASVGPLRSVQPATVDGRPMLLIGAQTGVMLVSQDALDSPPRIFRAPASQSSMGFNRAIIDESTRVLFASHKEYGVLGWQLDSGAIAANYPELTNARNLQLADPNRCIASSDSTLYEFSANVAPQVIASRSQAMIAGVIASSQNVIVVRADGEVEILDRAGREVVESRRRPGAICAAASLPWLGSIRLLLSREDAAIDCIGVEDQLVTQYLSPHRGCKIVAACADVVAAVSADRQRLILWHAWDGRAPFAEIHVTSQTRHRIADIDFG